MKINKFITAGVAAGISMIPSISQAITVAHISTIATKAPIHSGTSNVVKSVATPENMNAIQTMMYNNPTLTLLAFGSIAACAIIGVTAWAVHGVSKPYQPYKIKKPETSMLEKIKNIREKAFGKNKESDNNVVYGNNQ